MAIPAPPVPRTGLRRAVAALCTAGAATFLVSVLLHPERDGMHIAAANGLYELTHSIEAVGLILLVLALAATTALVAERLPGRDLLALLAALLGTTWYFGLIVVDGTRNPVTARYAPELVHTGADLDLATAVVVLPALLLFPLGSALLGAALARRGARLAGALLGTGAVVYLLGGIAIFALGPMSPAIAVLEDVGVVLYATGVVLMGRFWSRRPAADER